MWDTPFDESMLASPTGVVISCPDRDSVDDLMGILEQCGCYWPLRQRPTEENYWDRYEKETVYCVDRTILTYGCKRCQFASRYIKCTFYGAESPDFDVASDAELMSLLGMGSE